MNKEYRSEDTSLGSSSVQEVTAGDNTVNLKPMIAVVESREANNILTRLVTVVEACQIVSER